MFTHNPVTPVRLQILVELLAYRTRGLVREDVYKLLQPRPLDPSTGSGNPALVTVQAAKALGLAVDREGTLSLSPQYRQQFNSQEAILHAFDSVVLSNVEVEKYFAPYYAYILGLGKRAHDFRSYNNDQWAAAFNETVFENEKQANPFNGDKLTGLRRWFNFVGLGWYDPNGEFQPNPYERLQRALPRIFARQKKLEANAFMEQLAAACPELDGGELFRQANRKWDGSGKHCTLGLSHALTELHLDGVIRLSCPADSDGWNIGEAEPPRNEDFLSARFVAVEFPSKD